MEFKLINTASGEDTLYTKTAIAQLFSEIKTA